MLPRETEISLKHRHITVTVVSVYLLHSCFFTKEISVQKCIHIGSGTSNPEDNLSYLGDIFNTAQEIPSKPKQPTNCLRDISQTGYAL